MHTFVHAEVFSKLFQGITYCFDGSGQSNRIGDKNALFYKKEAANKLMIDG